MGRVTGKQIVPDQGVGYVTAHKVYAAEAITKQRVVYVSTGEAFRLTVSQADPSDSGVVGGILFWSPSASDADEWMYVREWDTLTDQNTSAAAIFAPVWLTTGGALTLTTPTTGPSIQVGMVMNVSATVGTYLIWPTLFSQGVDPKTGNKGLIDVLATIAVADATGGATTAAVTVDLTTIAGAVPGGAKTVMIRTSAAQWIPEQALNGNTTFSLPTLGTIQNSGSGWCLATTDVNGQFACTATNSAADEVIYFTVINPPAGIDNLTEACNVVGCVPDSAEWS